MAQPPGRQVHEGDGAEREEQHPKPASGDRRQADSGAQRYPGRQAGGAFRQQRQQDTRQAAAHGFRGRPAEPPRRRPGFPYRSAAIVTAHEASAAEQQTARS